MIHNKSDLIGLLQQLTLGSSIAEHDDLLRDAWVETSVYSDLLNDRVDLIPGTKGSGKSALYRAFVDFAAENLLKGRKVIAAHGVERLGDPVFRAYEECFAQLDEDDFAGFWCIYLISLAHEQFVKEPRYNEFF